MKAVALNIGFPGAGRVVHELANISDGKVEYREAYDLTWKDADLMFLPAWHPQYENLISEKKVMVWTSPIIQSEYTPIEFEFLKTILKLLDEGKIYAVWFGSKDWLPYAKKEGRKAFYCPYPVSLPPPRELNPPPGNNAGLFGPLGPRKNMAVQAMAAKKVKYHLYITDSSAGPSLKALGVPFADLGWQIPSRYHDSVIAMDIGLQCSIPGSESFSYVTWDFVSRGIPCLSTVNWVRSLSESFFVEDPYDIDLIARKITLHTDADPSEIRKAAEVFAKYRNNQVKSTLKEELGLDL